MTILIRGAIPAAASMSLENKSDWCQCSHIVVVGKTCGAVANMWHTTVTRNVYTHLETDKRLIVHGSTLTSPARVPEFWSVYS